MTAPDLAAFLAEDFERIGDAALARCNALEGRRLYVSGGTGFFGCNLLALLLLLQRQRGLRFGITVLSRDPQRFLAAAPWVAGLHGFDLLRGDAREPWPAGSGRHDLLLHAATDTHAGAHTDPRRVFDDMLAVTRQALLFAGAQGVQRLLLTGSGAQYRCRDRMPIGEEAPACASADAASAYGEGKRVAELLAAVHARRHGTAVVATRCFAFVGPGLPLDGHFAAGTLLRDALRGGPLRLHGTGSVTRSYLYSADLALWLLLLLLEAPAGAALNVGSDAALTIRELAERVRDVVCPDAAIRVGHSDAPEARPCYVPAIARARAAGLAVWTPLALALARTAQWHRLHMGGAATVKA